MHEPKASVLSLWALCNGVHGTLVWHFAVQLSQSTDTSQQHEYQTSPCDLATPVVDNSFHWLINMTSYQFK